jgi:hypothetical protein
LHLARRLKLAAARGLLPRLRLRLRRWTELLERDGQLLDRWWGCGPPGMAHGIRQQLGEHEHEKEEEHVGER